MALEIDDDPVVSRALELALRTRADLFFVHVVEDTKFGDPRTVPADFDAILEMLAADAQQAILGQIGAAALERIVPEVRILAGQPWEQIRTMACDYEADLLILGPGHPRGVRERVFGSTADRVVRTAPAPVIIVRKPALEPYRGAMAAVDFSEASAVALRMAEELAIGPIELVHVVDVPLVFEQAMRKAGTSQSAIEAYRQARVQAAHKRLLIEFPDAARRGMHLRARVLTGDAADVLVQLSRRRRTELIALGTKGRGVAADLVLGSVARRVILGAGCDILLASD